jgi:hypothetical protein
MINIFYDKNEDYYFLKLKSNKYFGIGLDSFKLLNGMSNLNKEDEYSIKISFVHGEIDKNNQISTLEKNVIKFKKNIINIGVCGFIIFIIIKDQVTVEKVV